MTYKEALALCWVVGFRKKNLLFAVAVMCAESGRYVGAYHVNTDGSTDRGLFEINDRFHSDLSDEEAYQALPNAAYAWGLSKRGTNWTPWAAFNSGAYLVFVPIVAAVRALGTWRSRIKEWEPSE